MVSENAKALENSAKNKRHRHPFVFNKNHLAPSRLSLVVLAIFVFIIFFLSKFALFRGACIFPSVLVAGSYSARYASTTVFVSRMFSLELKCTRLINQPREVVQFSTKKLSQNIFTVGEPRL